MTASILRTAILLALVGALVGCPAVEAELDEVWGVTQSNLADADESVADDAEQGSVDPDDVDYDSGCPDGGSVVLAGTITQSVTPGEVAQSFDYTATFTGCTDGDLIIDGEVDYTFSQEVTMDVVQQWAYAGTLTYTGSYNGTCDVDVEGEQSVTESSASISWSGSFCGEDASVALVASSD
jgi:hypothetical protein